LPEIEAIALANRKIGLGVMGFAEMLIRLGISYRSAHAVTCARQVARFLRQQAQQASAVLAQERGVFPHWEKSRYAAEGKHLRNATLLSIAPTGTLAILADTSSSIEPLFALSYRRVGVLGEQTLTEYNPLLRRLGAHLGFLTPELLAVVATRGTLADAPQVPSGLRDLFATALEIPPRQHLLIQQAFQAEVDNAVSKTINLPTEATPEVIASIYRDAYAFGLKGITIYRSGSLAQQVLQLGVGEEPYEQECASKCDPSQCKL